ARELALTAKEYALLEYLVRRAGDVVSRSEIAEHVWDEHYDPLSNVVDVYIQRLRRKIEEAGAEPPIRTRRREGYTGGGWSGGWADRCRCARASPSGIRSPCSRCWAHSRRS